MAREALDPGTFVKALIFALTLPALMPVLTNLYLDPFRVIPWREDAPVALLGERGRDRYQHAGAVNSFAPGAIIIGHSHAGNFRPTQIDEALGWHNTFNLSLEGSSLHEQQTVARYALDRSKAAHVLWLFAPSNMLADTTATNAQLAFPTYLYNDHRLDDLQLFMSLPTQFYGYARERRDKIRELADERRRTGMAVDPRDRATSWMHLARGQFNRPGRIVGLYLDGRAAQTAPAVKRYRDEVQALQPLDPDQIRQPSGRADRIQEQIDRNITPIVAARPDVAFRIIVQPPFPALYWQQIRIDQPEVYRDYLYSIYAAITALDRFDNVRTYGFGTAPYTADLRLYKDRTHYHQVVNDDMVRALAADQYLLDSDNVVDFIRRFDAKITGYRVRDDWFTDQRSDSGPLSDAEALAILDDCC